ncbi:MAG: VanW family protein [Anaerolineales bacterium]|nr:VanW family protein [Anaerolineales bacterium]
MRKNLLTPVQRMLLILISGLGLFALAFNGLLIGYHLTYVDRIYPGVRVGWVDLSELTIEEATNLLTAEFDYPLQGKIILRDRDQTWTVSPSQVGLFFGSEYNARVAYDVGRVGPAFDRLSAQFNAWYRGINLPVTTLFDERIAQHYLLGIAAQVDIPTVEASLSITGTEVVVHPGQVGRNMDVPAILSLLADQMEILLDGEIPLVVEEAPPVILDVSEQAAVAERILSEPLVLRLPDSGDGDPGPWRFNREELAKMLVIERVPTPEGETYKVWLSSHLLRSFLESIAPGLYLQEANARFMFNDETQELELIEPSVSGQSLDIEASLQRINEQLAAGERKITLDMEYRLPDVTSEATAESLGITELVVSETSYFYGSSSPRKQNIKTAASQFYGVLVAPGETFSMAGILGDVSLDNGYAEAWIIFGDRTIKGVGGGVCQVSTTLFRTVFFGGFPIIERYPHAYRVYYYEQTYGGGNDSTLAGLDATVYVPLVDFKFKNDTEDWLLMETYVGDTYLTWKFYSTSDGRTVDWDTTGLTNIQDPPDPLYQENEDLAKGEIEQVDWAVDGADITVTREVYRDGEIIDSDIITTHYIPWRAVCEYGPGTRGVPPENPSKSYPCKPDKNND